MTFRTLAFCIISGLFATTAQADYTFDAGAVEGTDAGDGGFSFSDIDFSLDVPYDPDADLRVVVIEDPNSGGEAGYDWSANGDNTSGSGYAYVGPGYASAGAQASASGSGSSSASASAYAAYGGGSGSISVSSSSSTTSSSSSSGSFFCAGIRLVYPPESWSGFGCG
jgi:hypothetical protein